MKLNRIKVLKAQARINIDWIIRVAFTVLNFLWKLTSISSRLVDEDVENFS